jgi:hypothetical protein
MYIKRIVVDAKCRRTSEMSEKLAAEFSERPDCADNWKAKRVVLIRVESFQFI